MTAKEMEGYYKPLLIESLIPESFPPVALFMRSASGNHTLYKPAEIPFSRRDSDRLISNGTKTLYVRAGDFDDVCIYLEENLHNFLTDPNLSREKKNIILQQVCFEYVSASMASPYEIGARLERCRSLVRNLTGFITSMLELQEMLGVTMTRSAYLMTHTVQVAVLSMLMHDLMYTVEVDEMVEVGVGGMFHDIGFTFLSGDLVDYLDIVNEHTWRKVLQHPIKGYKFLSTIDCIGPVALNIVRGHHERWDGSGYPDHLKGNNISRSVQIAAACDIYSTLTNTRTYRKASTQVEALTLLKAEIGHYVSADVYAALHTVITGEKETR